MTDNERIWSYEFEKGKGLLPGQLLLSEPFMFDENFKRTVVLVCEHTEENGTVGLIVNKPIKLRLNEVLEDFPAFNGRLFLGGPVGTDTIQFLHTHGDSIEESIQLSDNLYWGGNFEQMKAQIASGKMAPDEIHFFLGYSGWSVGQLDEELQNNSWIINKANYKHIFQTPADNVWKEVMKSMGGIYETMSSYPENPILN